LVARQLAAHTKSQAPIFVIPARKSRGWRRIMSQIGNRSRHHQASKTVATKLAASQRVAVRVVAIPAILAALTALAQIYDSICGKGDLWAVFVAVGITAWWITIVTYLSDRRRR
jgi:hypothetical protein